VDATAVPTYQQLKVLEVCAQGCGAPAADGHELCEPHREAKRARQAKWLAKKRKRARRLKHCPDCPVDARPLREGERIWCRAHRIRRNRISALWSAGPGVDPYVDRSERVAAATRTHDDGRTRYHGQQRRGQQTHAALNAQDLKMASGPLKAFRAGLAELGRPEAKEWPRGEKQRVIDATIHEAKRHIRHLEDILERLGYFGPRGRKDEDA
jgi:hypothetical protein